jgi:MoxR-like ATPase
MSSIGRNEPTTPAEVREKCEQFRDTFKRLTEEIGKVIVGHKEVVEGTLACLFAGGNVLLEGVPGLGKTLLVRTLSETLSLPFSRIQFTPDLMPADVIGTNIVSEDPDTGRRQFVFQRGPIFAQVVLADEINRATPKTQSALLEAMQEHAVTSGSKTYRLEQPFIVLATQNPIEQEGTYPLPEAQLDRFLLNIRMDYPAGDEEVEVLRTTTGPGAVEIRRVMDAAGVLALRHHVREVPVAEPMFRYAADLVRGTRPGQPGAQTELVKWIRWGAGPRAGQALILGAKAHALLSGRFHVTADDIRRLLGPVLRHRVLVNFHAEAEGVTPDHLVERLAELVAPPRSGL